VRSVAADRFRIQTLTFLDFGLDPVTGHLGGGCTGGRGPSANAEGLYASVVRYAASVIALLLIAVAGFVWIRRRLLIRREARLLAAMEAAEADALAREREIIAEMERDFLRG